MSAERDMRCLIVILIFIYPWRVCSLSNLARQRPVWENNPWGGFQDWTAKKAVDGRYNDRSAAGGQCVMSDNSRKTASWRVDLGDVVSISHIDIYYRTDNFQMPTGYTARMAGFFLYVSNTTSKDDGHLCFHEIQTVNRTPSEDQSINCSVHGRYVIYYNERKDNVTYPDYYSEFAYYELCELEVYGCKDYRSYGDKCDLWCPQNCQERRCDVNTGHCLGCIPGYQGTDCSQNCGLHTYGLECRSNCGNCSRGEACNHVNGQCPRGCDRGVQGEKCQDECQLGYYGENCRNLCSVNCNVTSRCDRFTGNCDGGCKPGWTGNTCDQKCGTGKYGENCFQNCGHCKERSQCHHVDGFCVEGCSAGYNGSRCIEHPKEQMSCKNEQMDGILWNTTIAGITLQEPCPKYQTGVATRFCDEHGEWEPPNFINCTNKALVNASSLLDGIMANETQDQRIQETVNSTLQLMKNLTSSTSEIGAGDLSSSLGVLEKIITVTNATGLAIEKEIFYAVIDNILSPNNSNSWTTVSEETEKDPTFLLKNMDRFSKITLQNDNITAAEFNGSNFELVINQTKIDKTGIRFPDEQSNNVSQNSEEFPTSLELPKQASNATKAVNYVAVLYKTMSSIMRSDPDRNELKSKHSKKSKRRSFVNSPILSLTTQTDLGVLDPPLNLTFGHTVKNESTELHAVCVSWDFNLNKWSEEGCSVNRTNRQRTVCHCNHLTNFAILMRPYTPVTEESPFLKMMSFVGVAVSIAFTFLTSLIYILTWRFIRSDKNIMMLNICGSLILSYTMFISSVEQTANEVACVAITAIIHYLFLVTFFSMLGLGVYYFMSITVTYYALYIANNFKSKSRVHWFLGGIWGIPVIITATNLGAFWGKGYHLKSYCWLSIESGSLYLFIIPVCLISVINILIIVSLLRVLFASSIVARSSLQRKASSGLRSLGTLLPVLGVTWLFGILAVNEKAVVFQYLFVIANSLQGFFIFVSHVLLDKKVRQGIGNKYPSLSTIFSFAERGTKETTLSSQSSSTSKSNPPLMKPKKKSMLKRFRHSKVKESESLMLEKTMSTDCSREKRN